MGKYFYLISPRSKPIRLSPEKVYSFGREQSSTFVLPDTTVSRRHATLQGTATGYVLTDLDSRNGTFVNDQAIKERELRDGDRVRIGSFEFQIRMASDYDVELRDLEEKSRFLSGETIQYSLSAARLAMMGFAGKLEDFSLIEVINSLYYNGRTGRLSILGDGGANGEIFFEQGELTHASSALFEGEQAVTAMLHATGGSFAFEKDVLPPHRSIDRATMTVVLDACRVLDEAASQEARNP